MYSQLATKYRPKKFSQVVGQPDIPIIKTVVRDPSSLPPLLLLCGPSGVGKTTVARIIAASVNCPNADETGEPCGSCVVCTSIRTNSYPNVYELDAASCGKADQLRELVAKCYLSSNGVKLFILDEAQSISPQGWNVLLKVLEEPPNDCMFILLTSEPRKVPSKIRTRALRFNFRPVAPSKLRWYLGQLRDHAKLGATDSDLDIVVEFSEGSVRDALVMLEKCVNSDLTAKELFADTDLSVDYFVSILNKDYTGTLEVVDRWWSEVGDAQVILAQLATTSEKLALAKVGADYYCGPVSSTSYNRLVQGLGVDKIVGILDIVSDWFPQAHMRSQVTMLTAKLYKIVNGSVVNESTKAVTPTPQSQTTTPPTTDEIANRLRSL